LWTTLYLYLGLSGDLVSHEGGIVV